MSCLSERVEPERAAGEAPICHLSAGVTDGEDSLSSAVSYRLNNNIIESVIKTQQCYRKYKKCRASGRMHSVYPWKTL
jgi:hypothetical protein